MLVTNLLEGCDWATNVASYISLQAGAVQVNTVLAANWDQVSTLPPQLAAQTLPSQAPCCFLNKARSRQDSLVLLTALGSTSFAPAGAACKQAIRPPVSCKHDCIADCDPQVCQVSVGATAALRL